MKNNFKKELTQSFNKKYNYQNEYFESLLKEKQAKKPFLKTKLGYSLSLVTITIFVCCILTTITFAAWNDNKKNNNKYQEQIEYLEENYSATNISIVASYEGNNLQIIIFKFKDATFKNISVLYTVYDAIFNENDYFINIYFDGVKETYIINNAIKYIELEYESHYKILKVEYFVSDELLLNFIQKFD